MKLTKADRILIVILMLVSFLSLFFLMQQTTQANKADVYVKEEKVLSIDLNQDGHYSVDGTNGKVEIEVKDHAIRVTQENSPHHLCSRQGFVSDSNVPIVCLPNATVIQIEGDTKGDTVIQSKQKKL